MASTEIEFELSAHQFALMGYPQLSQGQSLTVQLETAVLEPDWTAEGWYAVQKETVISQAVRVGRACYAFAGQIVAADIAKVDDVESAAVMVQCGEIPLRVLCSPREDGQLPFGTWETRYLTGYGRIGAIVEDDFTTSVGQQISVTVWSFRRLILRPGDPLFGHWYETTELLPSPYKYDRVLVAARIHPQTFGS